MGKPRRLYQYLTALTALLTIVTSGLHYAWPSPSIPKFTSANTTSFQITNDEASWIIMMQLASPMISCFLGAVIIDVIGRKKSILLTAVPYFVAWLMIVFASSPVELYIARALAGISDGIAFTVIPLYVGEIADPEIRGLLCSNISVSWISGMLMINVLGFYLSIATTAAICSVVPVLLLITFVWMPESPYYLIMKNDIVEARTSLKKLKGTLDEEVEEELIRLQEAIKNQTKKGGVLELFTKRNNLRGLLIVMIVRNGQQMSGVAAISFYTLTIFEESGDFMSPFTATVLYVSIQLVMTFVCSVLIDKTGRRPLLIISVLGSGICLLLEGGYFYIKDYTGIDTGSFNFVPVVALIGFVIIFNVGAQPIALLIQGELFPTNVKGLASCLSEVYFCILASSFSKFFQIMKDNFGIYVPFCFYALCCMVNLVFVVLIVPETKGKTLEEIQDYLCTKKKFGKCDNKE